jgi:hypothetical protein
MKIEVWRICSNHTNTKSRSEQIQVIMLSLLDELKAFPRPVRIAHVEGTTATTEL